LKNPLYERNKGNEVDIFYTATISAKLPNFAMRNCGISET